MGRCRPTGPAALSTSCRAARANHLRTTQFSTVGIQLSVPTLVVSFACGEAPQRKYQSELLESKKNVISQQREGASLKSDLFETKLKLSKLQEENESLMKESAKTKDLYGARLQELQTWKAAQKLPQEAPRHKGQATHMMRQKVGLAIHTKTVWI